LLYSTPNFIAQKLQSSFSNCAYKCRESTDKADLEKSDAVLFELIEITENPDEIKIPSRNPELPNQDLIWACAIMESPDAFTTKYLNMSTVGNIFNYRPDSDYPMVSGSPDDR